ncbi:TAL effector repeat-containing protein [Mycetohabitans sp. B2]|nr:TAL effector repeat-containing protein [Mycetohabitans sp. B2]
MSCCLANVASAKPTAGNNGGAQALKAVFEHGPALTQAGRSNKEIVDMAAHRDAANQIRKMAIQLRERQ